MPGFLEHFCEGMRVEVTLIKSKATFRDDAGGNAWKGGARSDRANATMVVCDPVTLRAHLGGGEEGIATSVHRGTARMRRLTSKSDGVPFDAKGAKHGSERQIQIEQYVSLLDMQLDIRFGILQLPATVLQAFEVDAVLGQCIDQGNAIFVLQPSGLREIDMT